MYNQLKRFIKNMTEKGRWTIQFVSDDRKASIDTGEKVPKTFLRAIWSFLNMQWRLSKL